MYLHCASDAKTLELTLEFWQITDGLLKCKSSSFGRMKYVVASLLMENSISFLYTGVSNSSVFLKSKQFPSWSWNEEENKS